MAHGHFLERRKVLLGTAALAASSGLPRAGRAAGGLPLQLVTTFTSPRQVTGVAATQDGRVFVNFPRWEEDVAISVAELRADGSLTPFPDAGWNAYRDVKPRAPGNHFVCVQSVTVDPLGYLWVVDPAAPGLTFIVPGGPKLVRVNLATNAVDAVIPFGPDVAPQGTYLNDIRFTPDAKRAVITNSGQPGSLIVLDVPSGTARRVLDGHPSTQADRRVVITVNGRQLRMPDGQPPQFSADGLALDAAGEYAYWQATTGNTLYRAPLDALFDPSLSPQDLGAQVQVVEQTFVADGYWLTRSGLLLATSDEDNSVKRIEPDGTATVEVQDDRLLWPDSMAEGPGGVIYVTASHIPEMLMWQGPGVQQTALFRFQPSAS